PLKKEDIGGIIDLIIVDINKRLSDRDLKITLTDEVKNYIIEQAYDATYGARPLKRYLQKHVETLSAKLILSGDIKSGDTIIIDTNSEGLTAKII
ncbi:MAG: type VI secretion system ATPase TssH, partial [Lachnospiraceae bacterium]|nr:type VI secretion system ATPase TssH [Lachnospiraceae bacterium]